MSSVCIKARVREVCDTENIFDKDNAAETVRTHMLSIYQGPFTVCKCEFELPNAQMQKFHHWPQFNNSSVFKCLDNGHCDCTSLQFKNLNYPSLDNVCL